MCFFNYIFQLSDYFRQTKTHSDAEYLKDVERTERCGGDETIEWSEGNVESVLAVEYSTSV